MQNWSHACAYLLGLEGHCEHSSGDINYQRTKQTESLKNKRRKVREPPINTKVDWHKAVNGQSDGPGTSDDEDLKIILGGWLRWDTLNGGRKKLPTKFLNDVDEIKQKLIEIFF